MPQLGRVHPELVGEQSTMRSTRYTASVMRNEQRVGDAAGRLVRVDARDLAVRGLEVVGAGEDVEEAGRVLRRLRGGVERAVVGEHVDAQRRGSCRRWSAAISPCMW